MIIVFLGGLLMMLYCLPLNAIATNNDEMLRSLGINPEKIRTIAGLLTVLMTSTIISFTGIIGFVGLIAPHMARFIIGNNHRFYLPFTGLLGAILLLVSDTLGKIIIQEGYKNIQLRKELPGI